MTENDSLDIEVENCGPIVEAKFDMRPLTVFIGPSNTGKSYLAVLLYGLHRLFNTDNLLLFDLSLPEWLQISAGRGGKRETDRILESIGRINRQMRERPAASSGRRAVTVPPGITRLLKKRMKARDGEVLQEFQRCFGFDGGIRSLIRKGSSGARIACGGKIEGFSSRFGHEVLLTSKESSINVTMPPEFPLSIDKSVARRLLNVNLNYKADELEVNLHSYLRSLYMLVFRRLLSPLDSSAHYLPADRTGIMHSHRVVFNSLLAKSTGGGISSVRNAGILSGVVSDFLEQLGGVDSPRPGAASKQRGSGSHAEEMEDRILNGTIEVHRTAIGFPDFYYRPRLWHGRNGVLHLRNASSMVSELAPVVLYLRHVAVPGDTLIVEEPESHLHPEMQVEFTRQMAGLVNSGIRVVVTTHSEMILEELANIVRRSQIKGTGKTRYVDADKVSLRHDQVGAWQFEERKRPQGSVVKEMLLDESGLYPTGFDEVANEVHNEGSLISWEIESLR